MKMLLFYRRELKQIRFLKESREPLTGETKERYIDLLVKHQSRLIEIIKDYVSSELEDYISIALLRMMIQDFELIEREIFKLKGAKKDTTGLMYIERGDAIRGLEHARILNLMYREVEAVSKLDDDILQIIADYIKELNIDFSDEKTKPKDLGEFLRELGADPDDF